MTELGTRLKEARLSKGYSLDDLQEITKIQKRYLMAIEEGNYSMMPGSFYVRAFIKQYAEAVGLNADEILENYKSEIPGAQSNQVSQSMSQSPSRRKLAKRPSNKMMEAMPKIIAALFIVVIIVAMWILSQSKNGVNDPGESDNSSQIEYVKNPYPIDIEKEREEQERIELNKKEEQEELIKEEEAELKQTISAGTIESDGETTSYTLTGTDVFKIRIEVSGSTWVGIRDQNRTELLADTRAYNAGEVVEFDATSQNYVRIRLGNSGNAKVFINDELLTYAQQKVTQNIVINFNKEQ